jgi:hypothetical protein
MKWGRAEVTFSFDRDPAYGRIKLGGQATLSFTLSERAESEQVRDKVKDKVVQPLDRYNRIYFATASVRDCTCSF